MNSLLQIASPQEDINPDAAPDFLRIKISMNFRPWIRCLCPKFASNGSRFYQWILHVFKCCFSPFCEFRNTSMDMKMAYSNLLSLIFFPLAVSLQMMMLTAQCPFSWMVRNPPWNLLTCQTERSVYELTKVPGDFFNSFDLFFCSNIRPLHAYT